MPQAADLLVTNAAVYTVDPTNLHAAAVAVQGNVIAFVGSAREAEAWRGPQTEVIDAGGNTLLPGFIDSHFHLLWGSLKLNSLQLDSATDLAQMGELLYAYATAHPEQEWIEGYQLRYQVTQGAQRLDRHFLDAIVPDRPVLLFAFDMHTAWANTVALQRGDILKGRDLPPGNAIVIDPTTGAATGELREPEAYTPVRTLIPKPDKAQQHALLRQGLALAAQHGITSVHNMDGTAETIALYAALEAAGEMTLRIYVPYDVKPETPLEALQEAVAWRQQYQGSHVRAGAVKLFMDGVLESTTAFMVDDYTAPTGQPSGNRGNALYSAEHFNRIAAEADRLGLQIFVHACGDGAVRRTLDGYAHARRQNEQPGTPRDSRHRIEHIEVIHPTDIARFAQLGVIASMQPLHAPVTGQEGEVWMTRAGVERWPLSFAWETLRQAGAHLVFGSDWPVVTLDPLQGFYAALNRRPWAPEHPVQRQDLAQIIAGYTHDAAYAEFQTGRKGMIRTGLLADLVLFDGNLFATLPAEIAQVRPVLTVCDGRVVFRQG
ncbi:MAG: amidohydrolase [Caldilineaceae bacterium]